MGKKKKMKRAAKLERELAHLCARLSPHEAAFLKHWAEIHVDPRAWHLPGVGKTSRGDDQ